MTERESVKKERSISHYGLLFSGVGVILLGLYLILDGCFDHSLINHQGMTSIALGFITTFMGTWLIIMLEWF